MLETIKLTVYAILVAHLAHEATHYSLALLFDRRPSLGVFGIRDRGLGQYVGTLYVRHDGGAELTVGDWLIHTGPIVVGCLVAIGYLALGGVPPVWGVLGWVVYTLVGAPNDLRFREVGGAEIE